MQKSNADLKKEIRNLKRTIKELKTVETKKTAGRPLKYTDPQKMQKDINAYFDKCDDTLIKRKHVTGKGAIDVEIPTPYTMAGLAAALSMGRTTLNAYGKSAHYTEWKGQDPEKAEKFRNIIACARQKIEESNLTLGLAGCHESRLSSLNLTSNYGYTTRTEQDIKAKSDITILTVSYKGASGRDFEKERGEGAQASETKHKI